MSKAKSPNYYKQRMLDLWGEDHTLTHLIENKLIDSVEKAAFLITFIQVTTSDHLQSFTLQQTIREILSENQRKKYDEPDPLTTAP